MWIIKDFLSAPEQEQESRPSSTSSVYKPVYYHGEIIDITDNQLSENTVADRDMGTAHPTPDEGVYNFYNIPFHVILLGMIIKCWADS